MLSSESRAFNAFVMDDAPARMEAALARAKDAVGGATGLAEKLPGKITPQAVSQWKRVPAERVRDVSRITGVPPHELRPDIFGAPEGAEPARAAS